MFSKRHYEVIAQQFQNYRSDAQHIQNRAERETHAHELEVRLSDMFARDNAAFDGGGCLRACLPGNNVRARG